MQLDLLRDRYRMRLKKVKKKVGKTQLSDNILSKMLHFPRSNYFLAQL